MARRDDPCWDEVPVSAAKLIGPAKSNAPAAKFLREGDEIPLGPLTSR